MSYYVSQHLFSEFRFAKKEEDVPDFIPKMQLNDSLETIPEKKNFYISEKLDGISVSYYFYDESFGVCSKNKNIKSKNNSYWKMERKYNIFDNLFSFMRNIAIQGEIVGPGIKNNKYNLDDLELYIFNIMYLDDGFIPGLFEMFNTISFFGLNPVPIIKERACVENFEMLEYIRDLAKGYSNISNTLKEGIVLKPLSGEYQNDSFKVLNPEFISHYYS